MPNKPSPAVFPLLAACLVCAAPALWAMWPVLLAPDSSLPGRGFGDNAAALWNVWWFAEGSHVPGWPYWTPMLFAPFGTQLSLHTHATTHSLLAWPWTSITSVVAGHNLAMAAGLVLNGVCTFLLALRLTGRLLPSVAAGLLFSAGAPVQVRVLGHINLLHAWVLPLFALALTHLTARPAIGRAVLLGAAGALVAYTDYYYAVYAVLLVIVWAVARVMSLRFSRMSPRTGLLTNTVMVLLAVDLVVIVIVAITGGTALNFGPLTVSLRGLRNPLTLFWLLLAVWLWRRYPAKASFSWHGRPPVLRDGLTALAAVAAFAALTLPLWLSLLQVVASGEYATHRVLWRSSPAGGDLLTIALGHPRHVLTGGWTASAYSALGIDVMEQSLWLGLVPLVLLAVSPRQWLSAPSARLWALIGIVFAVLALGPFLRIGGVDTALPLPQALLRYVPVFSNARMPGRAIVVVLLAVALLSALALANRSNRLCAAVLLLLAAESFPAPVPVQRIPPPDAVDEILRTSPEQGAVAELPTGLRDGFGEEGAFDHRALLHQMHHQRPVAGGFVARLAPRMRRSYTDTPGLLELLRISTPSGSIETLEPAAADRAADSGIAFLVVNRDTFVDARLPRAALEHAGFRFVEVSGSRELYATRRPAGDRAVAR